MRSRLPELMKAKGVTIYDLIEQTGLSKETITRARDHRIQHCSLLTLSKIAAALDTSPRELFESTSSPGETC
jgi:DNA-binding Xre family transcriptional regulator